jgi:CBS domain-containing protein
MLIGAMQALEIMKTHVVKTTPDATLGEAVDLMDLYQVSGLPVVDAEGNLCGMLTEQDVLQAMQEESQHPLGLNPLAERFRVADYMTSPPVSVTENCDVLLAARLMLTQGLKRLPVTTDTGKVIGTLNRIDILQAIFEGNL